MANDITTLRHWSRAMAAKVVQLAESGLPKKHIAAKVGVNPSTLDRWLDPVQTHGDDYEEFRIKFHAARAHHQEKLLANISEAGEVDPRNWKASAWILERLYPLEYSERKQITHTANRAGITQEQFNALSVSDQERYMEAARVMQTLAITSGEDD